MTDPLLVGVADQLEAAHAGPPAWWSDPVAFTSECIAWPAGQSLADYQAANLAALASTGRVAVRSAHGVGKTTTAAVVVLWFALSRDAAGTDWKVVTTAGAWRQLTEFLWPEIRRWARLVRWDAVGRSPLDPRSELLGRSLRLKHGQAFAAASDDPALLEGAHAASLLLVLDEAKAIPDPVWDAVEGALSGTGEVLALASSTPGAPSGRFWEIHQRRPGLTDWDARHVTLREAVDAGRVSPTWVEGRRLQWGENSAVFQNRVLGEFASSDSDGVIPLQWVEAAIDRWREWVETGGELGPGRSMFGVDVARSGSDKTVIAARRGLVVSSIESHVKEDTMMTTGRVMAAFPDPTAQVVVDVIGVGAGVVDRLREQGVAVVEFNSSARAVGSDHSGTMVFENARAEAWWRLRDLLNPAYGPELALPDDDELIGDLCAPRWKFNSTGRVQIESKDDIRRRLGRSPDMGDAVVMVMSLQAGSGEAPVVVTGSVSASGSRWGRDFSPSWVGSGRLFGGPGGVAQRETWAASVGPGNVFPSGESGRP